MPDEMPAEQPTMSFEPEAVPPLPARRQVPPLAAGLVGLVVGAGAVGAAWGLSGGSPVPKPTAAATFVLTGTLTLSEASPGSAGSCEGKGGYSDITPGAAVTVYDAAGAVIGKGYLGNGSSASASGYGACEFQFSVQSVPEGSKFYQVEISHRGKLTVSAEDAKAGRFASSLG
jgi:hypothetical protein